MGTPWFRIQDWRSNPFTGGGGILAIGNSSLTKPLFVRFDIDGDHFVQGLKLICDFKDSFV